jgi:hypothetical protein
MSEENVELARQAYHAFNRRDLASLLALIDADAEAVPRLAAVEGVFLDTTGSAAGGRTCSPPGRTTRSKSSRFGISATLRWETSRLRVTPPTAASR